MQWGLNVHQQPRQLDKRLSDLKLKAGIWIPYGEVYQYYLSRKARMMKHPLQG